MKKLILPYILLLMPVFAVAQGQSFLLKDAFKKVDGVASAFRFNDHLGIMQVKLNETSFELIALDDKMSVLWRASFKGTGVACGKFKGNILAISDWSYNMGKGNINPWYASLIDPATGKLILQNQIFAQKAKHYEDLSAFFSSDGSDVKLIVRQAETNLGWLGAYKNKTEDFTIISLNEKLQPAYLKPKIPDENFVSLAVNNAGDLFVMTTRDGNSLELRRYAQGSTEPSAPIVQACDQLDKPDLVAATNAITPSETDRNIVYLSIAHNNPKNVREIITAKFNFATQQSQAVTGVFTGKQKRALEKAYVPVNNAFPAVNLGAQKQQLQVKYFEAHDGKVISVAAESFSTTVDVQTTYYEHGLIITCYDSDLKQLFQQVMLVGYTEAVPLTTGYSFGKNDLKVVSNKDFGSAYGQLDLSTGKWLKLVSLNTGGADTDQHIIWFGDHFIVPYLHRRGFGTRYNIDLGLNGY